MSSFSIYPSTTKRAQNQVGAQTPAKQGFFKYTQIFTYFFLSAVVPPRYFCYLLHQQKCLALYHGKMIQNSALHFHFHSDPSDLALYSKTGDYRSFEDPLQPKPFCDPVIRASLGQAVLTNSVRLWPADGSGTTAPRTGSALLFRAAGGTAAEPGTASGSLSDAPARFTPRHRLSQPSPALAPSPKRCAWVSPKTPRRPPSRHELLLRVGKAKEMWTQRERRTRQRCCNPRVCKWSQWQSWWFWGLTNVYIDKC